MTVAAIWIVSILVPLLVLVSLAVLSYGLWRVRRTSKRRALAGQTENRHGLYAIRRSRSVPPLAHVSFGMSRSGPVVNTRRDRPMGVPDFGHAVHGRVWPAEDSATVVPVRASCTDTHDYYGVRCAETGATYVMALAAARTARADAAETSPADGVHGEDLQAKTYRVDGALDVRRGFALTREGIWDVRTGELAKSGTFTAFDVAWDGSGQVYTTSDEDALALRVSRRGSVAVAFPDRVVLNDKVLHCVPYRGLLGWTGETLCVCTDLPALCFLDTSGNVLLTEELRGTPRALETSDDAAYVVFGASSIFSQHNGKSVSDSGTVETFLVATHGVLSSESDQEDDATSPV